MIPSRRSTAFCAAQVIPFIAPGFPALRDLGDALTQINPELLIHVAGREAIQLQAISRRPRPGRPQRSRASSWPRPVDREPVIADAMLAGARDVVSLSNPARLKAVMLRELRAFRLERALNTTVKSAQRCPHASSSPSCSDRTMRSSRCRKASWSMPIRPGSSCSAASTSAGRTAGHGPVR